MRYVDPDGRYEITAEDGQAYIIIQQGDTLWDVVKGQSPHISDVEVLNRINDIIALNNLVNPDKIIPGDKFKAPNSVVPDITEDLLNRMQINAADGKINWPFYFKNKVQKGGDWDFKSDVNSIYCSNPLQYYNYIFNGEILRYDAPGNIHYGYVGKATFWATDWLLFKGAGAAQLSDNPNGNWTEDDSYDSYCIQKGIDLYKAATKGSDYGILNRIPFGGN